MPLKTRLKRDLFLLVFTSSSLFLGLSFSSAFALEPDFLAHSESGFEPVVSVFGGIGNIQANSQSQTNTGDDNEIFTYSSDSENKTSGLAGVFLGVAHSLPHQFFIETGLEYSYLGSIYINGNNTTGNDPESSTAYGYQYKFQTQQALAVAKFFTHIQFSNTQHVLYPYVSIGLGAAFNKTSNFSASPQESGSVNLTPSFNNHTETSLSFSLGLGLETNISQNITAGVGYKFIDFGKASMGQGQVNMNNYSSPVNFNLEGPKTYANEFSAQINYFF